MEDDTLKTIIESEIKKFNKTLINQQKSYQFSKYSKEDLIKNFYTLNIELDIREHLLQWVIYDLTMNTKDILVVKSQAMYNALVQENNTLYADLNSDIIKGIVSRIFWVDGGVAPSVYTEKNFKVICLNYSQMLFKLKLQKKTIYQYLATYFPNLDIVVGLN